MAAYYIMLSIMDIASENTLSGVFIRHFSWYQPGLEVLAEGN